MSEPRLLLAFIGTIVATLSIVGILGILIALAQDPTADPAAHWLDPLPAEMWRMFDD